MSENPESASRYSYRVTWSAGDQEYVATCIEFPSLSHFESEQAMALAGIRDLVSDVIADLRSQGESVRPPLSQAQYSGQFVTRVPKDLHARLALEAREAGISLNRLVSYKLASPLALPERARTPRPARKRA